MKNKKKTRKARGFYRKNLADNLAQENGFLIDNLRKEWEMLERGARKEQLVREIKEGVKVSAETILKLLAIGGVCTAVLVTPKIFTLVAEAQKYKKFLSKEKAREKLYYLKRLGYVEFESVGNNTYRMKITDKGLARVLEDAFRLGEIYKNQKWDGKWRVVFFDIPEKHKSTRDSFRLKLIDIGFRKIQDSVFVCPYPCEREITFLISMYNLMSYVYFLETDHMINDDEIKKRFKLV